MSHACRAQPPQRPGVADAQRHVQKQAEAPGLSLAQGRAQLLTPRLALPAVAGSCLASGGTPKPAWATWYQAPAPELGSVRAAQTQTSEKPVTGSLRDRRAVGGHEKVDVWLKPEEGQWDEEGERQQSDQQVQGQGDMTYGLLWDTSKSRGPIHTLLRQQSVTGLGELGRPPLPTAARAPGFSGSWSLGLAGRGAQCLLRPK